MNEVYDAVFLFRVFCVSVKITDANLALSDNNR